ncbi:MAG: SusC/RagA family TonB-linked outer membrane protein [Dysgonamonadaceae bacterium]|jgi:TonB-linked SusC/RagA family outer membrane protein|nr:SusC/RagA family TonB-linked outer membrane protein [Dysgonamonadaceae bacterium]
MTKVIQKSFIKKFRLVFYLFLLISVFSGQVSAQNAKKDTARVSTVHAKDVEQELSTNTAGALEGRAAGVQLIDGKVQIRGQKNLIGSNPLFIVDGVRLPSEYVLGGDELNNPLNLFNSTNIEKIELLKSAEETARYGPQGANGVVLITTKNKLTSHLQVDARISAGFIQPSTWYDFLNTEEYLDIRRKALAADNITPTASNAYDLETWSPNDYTDWQKEYLRKTGGVTQGQVSFSGGTGKTYFYVNADYYETNNIYLAEDDDKTKRLNTRLLVNHTSDNDKFNFNAALSYGILNSKERGSDPDGESSYLVYAPNMPKYNEDGSLYWLNSSVSNPLRLKYTSAEKRNRYILGTTSFAYRPFKEIDVKLDIGYNHTGAEEYSAILNGYLNPHANNSYQNRVVNGGSFKDVISIEPYVNYTKDIGYGTLTGLLGFTYHVQSEGNYAFELRDFPDETRIKTFDAAAVKNSVEGTSGGNIKRASVFGRLGYFWKNRYLLNLNFRRDGSSIFAPGHRWNYSGAAGAGWIFSKEDWVQDNLPFFNYGKLRASYGIIGNDQIASFLYLNQYRYSTYSYNGSKGLYLSSVANPNFKWEVTHATDIALEFGLFKDRLQGSVTLQRTYTEQIVGGLPLSSQSGFTEYKDNLPDALVRNQGIEIELIAPQNFGKFEWIPQLTLTIPQYNTLLKFDGIENTSYATTFKVGESMNITRLYKFTGIDPTNGAPTVEDVDENGVISSTYDKQFLKDTDPDLFGGLGNSFRYKNLRLDVFFTFELRPFAEGYLKSYYYPLGYVNRNILKKYATDYWTPENPNASRPGLTTSTSSTIGNAYYLWYTESDAVYTNNSYIRLKNISLSYDLPGKLLDKFGASYISLFAIGENLALWSKTDQWDPTTGQSVPPLRTVTAGIKVRF